MHPSVLVANNYAHVRGGSDRCFLEHVRLLAAHGHRVRALATRPPPGRGPAPVRPPELPPEVLDDALLLEPVDLERPGPRALLRFHHSRAARRAVERLLSEPDPPRLAHLHIVYGQLTTSILAPLRRAGIPIVQTLHEYRLACPVSTFVSQGRLCEACSGGAYWRALPRRCNRGSLARTLVSVSEASVSRALGSERAVDLFLAPSEFLRQKMLAHGLAPERVRHLPNFVAPEAYVPARGPGEHVLYAGRLERVKGVLTLARAAARARSLPLLFAGEGEARAELEALVRTEGLGHVHVLGHQGPAALAELVARARCVVLPAEWYENQPMAILEAMARARAVLATRIGGIPELVRPGQTGHLVPPGDVEALAEALEHAAREPEECLALGRAARARIEEEFSAEVHYARLREVYRSLVG